jgi:hypothetical protein
MHTYKMWKHRGWGNRIEFDAGQKFDLENRGPYRVNGHLQCKPRVGDILLVRAYGLDDYLRYVDWSVGKVAILELEFTKIEDPPYSEPRDQFFAEVRWLQYRPNTDEELEKEHFSRALYSALKDEGFYEPFRGFVQYASTRLSALG